MSGSSPRLRGTLDPDNQSKYLFRFIPASAGNTIAQAISNTAVAVHPRVCGEHCHPLTDPSCRLGSSPRLRGTLLISEKFMVCLRFIPASAGNTRLFVSNSLNHPVHPRVCGEHLLGFLAGSRSNGSSPRLRGTRFHACKWYDRKRFIPASAGNTIAQAISNTAVAVHPRVCGEHCHPLTDPSCRLGSSPRLRGTLLISEKFMVCLRFIPASAGNTRLFVSNSLNHPVHPRVCGEHLLGFLAGSRSNGSSPRLRGTRFHACKWYDRKRFIPASAGNTPGHPAFLLPRSVHPRVCGEHISC